MTRIHRLGAIAIPVVLAAVLAGWQFGGAAGAAAFQIVANETAANAGQNFNGASHGHLVVTVPARTRAPPATERQRPPARRVALPARASYNVPRVRSRGRA